MPRVCTICTHDQRQAIDAALLRGDSFRDIARQFHASKDALSRHKHDHLGERMAKVAAGHAEADVRTAIDVVTQLSTINEAALTVLSEAKAAGDGALALQAIDRIQRQIELQAKLINLLHDGTMVNVTVSPQWTELRSVILTVLHDYPEARVAVAEALREQAGGASHGRA